MKTSGLVKWGEGVARGFRLFVDALKNFNEDHCLWIYYTAAIFLFGGEIASLLEQEESVPVDI